MDDYETGCSDYEADRGMIGAYNSDMNISRASNSGRWMSDATEMDGDDNKSDNNNKLVKQIN